MGACLLYLAAGTDPLPLADRPTPDRMRDLIAFLARDMPAVRRLAPAVLGSRTPHRNGAGACVARAFLAQPGQPPPIPSGPDERGLAKRLLADGLEHLVRTMRPGHERLWPADEPGSACDPVNVQQGAAGVLGVLTRAARQLADDRLREAVGAAAAWLDERLFTVPRILSGLHFGRSGPAWAMYDAATLLDDGRLAARAVELALRVPVAWPNPDVCHGAAGAGLTLLHLWHATGDDALRERAAEAADGVLAAAVEHDGRLHWPVPESFDSNLAGVSHYGFAHGVAGVAMFLLYAGLATGREEYVDAARRAGDTLAAVADVEGAAAWWPAGPRPGGNSRWPHWCSGSAGVGTFLIRLWLVTGADQPRELAEAAAVATHRHRWYSNTSACHGLAGHGEFLLDLADLTGEPAHRHRAEDVAATIGAHHVVRDGRAVLPGDHRHGGHGWVQRRTGRTGGFPAPAAPRRASMVDAGRVAHAPPPSKEWRHLTVTTETFETTDIALLDLLPTGPDEQGINRGPTSCAQAGTVGPTCGPCTDRLCHPDRDTCV